MASADPSVNQADQEKWLLIDAHVHRFESFRWAMASLANVSIHGTTSNEFD
jgi:hypothetical protein